MALTPDFDTYPDDVTVTNARLAPRWVAVSWSDGTLARFHHAWLRDNCPCAGCVHQVTKEQVFEFVGAPVDNPPSAAEAGDDGTLEVVWSVDGHHSSYDAGWLFAYRYDDGLGARPTEVPDDAPVVWDGSTEGVPATFDGPAVLADDEALLEWLLALRAYGLTRLRDVPTELDAVGRVAARIGIVRETNFGVLWDVRSEVAPVTNANTSFALPPHVDLATREYQPGLQFLHCIENSTRGGQGTYLDGLRVADVLRAEQPDAFRVLTTVPWQFANRSPVSDYRWAVTPIVLDAAGNVTEVRVGNWLRAPLAVAFDDVEPAYAALRALFELTYRQDLAVRTSLEPGDVLAFDNRRILHGRDAFEPTSGRRFLRGCYGERDELASRIRILQRSRREDRLSR